ncbi:hypothetical protein JCM8097_008165 [Rhodosporidiobolus ruineniae]
MNENSLTVPALAPVPVVKPASLQGLPAEIKIRIVDRLDEIAHDEPDRQFERYNARQIDRDFYAICSARQYKGLQVLSDLPAFLSFCTIHLPIHGRHVRWLGISTRRPFIWSPDRKRDFQIAFLRSERLQDLTGGSFDLAKQHDAVLAYAVSLCPNLRSVQVKLRELSGEEEDHLPQTFAALSGRVSTLEILAVDFDSISLTNAPSFLKFIAKCRAVHTLELLGSKNCWPAPELYPLYRQLATAVNSLPSLRTLNLGRIPFNYFHTLSPALPLLSLAVHPHGDMSSDDLIAELALTYRFLQSSGSALTSLALADFPVHDLSVLPPLNLPHLASLALSHLCKPALQFAPFAHFPLSHLYTASLCISELDDVLAVLESYAVPLQKLTVERFRHEDEERWDWDQHPVNLAAEERLRTWCDERSIRLRIGGGEAYEDDVASEHDPYPHSDSWSWPELPHLRDTYLAEDALQAHYSSNPDYEARKEKGERRRDGMRKDRRRYERRKSK